MRPPHRWIRRIEKPTWHAAVTQWETFVPRQPVRITYIGVRAQKPPRMTAAHRWMWGAESAACHVVGV